MYVFSEFGELRWLRRDGRCGGGGDFGDTPDAIGLRTLVALDHVKLNCVSLFEGLVAVELDCAEVDEDVRTTFTCKESVSLRVVEPTYLTCVLSHVRSPFAEPDKLPVINRMQIPILGEQNFP
jgi:hypothetical protein